MDNFDEVLNLLKLDMQSGGITKRNENKVMILKLLAEKLQEYFSDEDVKVRLNLNTGFNSLAFLSISGKSVSIDNKAIFKVFRDGASYLDIIADEDKPGIIELLFGFTDLSL